MSITTAQIRGARGILDWSQADLSARTGISATSIGSIENNQSTPRASTLETIRKAFETEGIEFMGGDGVRVRTGNIKKFHGKEGVMAFYQDLYKEAESDNRDFLLNNVDEDAFLKWCGGDQDGLTYLENHKKKCEDLNIKYKILVKEGDTNFISSSYSEYRWSPAETFGYVSFFVFGKKLAILLFEKKDDPEIIVLDYPAVSEAYRLQFMHSWKNALVPVLNGEK